MPEQLTEPLPPRPIAPPRPLVKRKGEGEPEATEVEPLSPPSDAGAAWQWWPDLPCVVGHRIYHPSGRVDMVGLGMSQPAPSDPIQRQQAVLQYRRARLEFAQEWADILAKSTGPHPDNRCTEPFWAKTGFKSDAGDKPAYLAMVICEATERLQRAELALRIAKSIAAAQREERRQHEDELVRRDQQRFLAERRQHIEAERAEQLRALRNPDPIDRAVAAGKIELFPDHEESLR